MPESEEALLRRAAKLIRETAAPANDTDWRVAVDTEGQLVMGAGGSEVAECLDPYDAAWIALVGRQLAEPLAAWLDDTAEHLRGRVKWGVTSLALPNHVTSALIVARTLLGEIAVPAPVGDDHQEGQP